MIPPRRLSALVLGVAALLLAAASPAHARGRRKKRFWTTGLVRTTRTPDGQITAVVIHDDRGTDYHVTLDKKGLVLGQTMDWQKTRATGDVTTKNGEHWLTLAWYANLERLQAEEQWRRMKCNYCVVAPARINATLPRDLRGARPIDGRPYAFRRDLGAWTRDARFLWVATDNQVFQINLDAKRLVRSYGIEDGLPDRVVHQMLSNGKTLYLAHRGGVSMLRIGGPKITDLPQLKSRFARLARGNRCVWVVADSGTFRIPSPDAKPETLPAAPTAGRIRRVVENGIWLPPWNWTRSTAHFFDRPVCVGDRLYVTSYGDVYELARGQWRRLGPGRELSAGAGRVWFLRADAVVEYDPATGRQTAHRPPSIPRGRCRRLLVTPSAVWVSVEPAKTRGGFIGGGIARLDLASRKWQSWNTINGRKVTRVGCLVAADDSLYAVNAEGRYRKKPAHPGMTYVQRVVFDTTGLCLHRYVEKDERWETLPLGLPAFEKRLILGQDGQRGRDEIVPQAAERLAVGPTRLFAVLRLFPRRYFCGYYLSVDPVARRSGIDAPWCKDIVHRPQDLGLQGEQPLVLNISNTGRMVLEGVGHDSVLGVFVHQGTHWAVTQGRVSWFDDAAGRWRTVLEPGFRFYWRATAALEDEGALYVGSDRGLVSRLDLRTGRFEFLVCLRQRSISSITKDQAGRIVVGTRPAPLGILPVQLRGTLRPKEWLAASFDGKTWTQCDPKAVPRAVRPPWFIRRLVKRHRWDKSRGNFLFRVTDRARPAFYVKGVFYPKILCTGAGGDRLWLSTQCGLLRLDGVQTPPVAGG